jgi:mRNA interferase HicA
VFLLARLLPDPAERGSIAPLSLIAIRTKLSDTCPTRGNEFIRKVLALAKARGLACRVDEKRGKGSHVTLYFGERLTVVRNPKDELKTGTLHAMCKQLDIRRVEL